MREKILKFLTKNPGATARQAADKTGCTIRRTCEILKACLDHGMVTREGTRRKYQYTVTAKGSEASRAVRKAATK